MLLKTRTPVVTFLLTTPYDCGHVGTEVARACGLSFGSAPPNHTTLRQRLLDMIVRNWLELLVEQKKELVAGVGITLPNPEEDSELTGASGAGWCEVLALISKIS